MKLSRNEFIFSMIFLSALIIVIGFFLFISPKITEIDQSKAAVVSKQTQYNNLVSSLNGVDEIDGKIMDLTEALSEFTEKFYHNLATFEADQLSREYWLTNNLSTNSLSITNFTTSDLSISYKTGSSTNDKLLQPSTAAATVIPEEVSSMITSDELKTTLGAVSVSFTYRAQKHEYIRDFLDYIMDLDKASYINGITINMLTEDEDGKPITEYTGSVSITYYCVNDEAILTAVQRELDILNGVTAPSEDEQAA